MLWAAAVAVTAAAGSAYADKSKTANPDVLYKASVLDGLAVQNDRGESLGKVHDLAIDPKAGRIVYYAVGYGGTAGIGDKLFAVPFDCAKLTERAGRPNEHVLVVVSEKRHFDLTPGFDKNHWPMTGDDAFYNHPGQPQKPAAAHAPESIVRAKAVYGSKVKNPQGEDLGKIHDLMIAMKNGSIAYAAISHGATAGVGGKLFAVACGNMRTEHPAGHPDQLVFVLEVPKSEFDNDPGFNKDAWPPGPNPKFGKPAHGTP
jgi:sporulation protein YlmC with PRC-barrel domain